jgi:hypothetical protein
MTGTPRSRARLNGRCGFQRFSSGRVNGRNRRYLAVAARSGEGPFTYPLQTPNHRALQTVVC